MMPDPPSARDLAPTAGPGGGPSRPAIALAAGRTEVVFTWAGDRWRHVVTVAGGPPWESVDAAGDGDPRWPASPPLVEVSRVETGGGPALAAVGLAGRSHFSASVIAHPSAADTLLFEVACRLHEPPGWLGSSYRRADGMIRVKAPGAAAALPATVRWAYAIGPGGVRPLPGDDGPHGA